MIPTTERYRYFQHTLDASMKPRYRYHYFVTGRGEFPLDMLRYDCAWPLDSEAATRMAGGYGGHPVTQGLRSVHLVSYREPTIDRWASFGWSVGQEELSGS